MPSSIENQNNSEEIKDIITSVPAWILRWGIALIFAILLGILLLSSFIRYPDVVKATVKINSLNAPKTVLAHQTGKLVKILANENALVEINQPLAFIESTANHSDVILFAERLKALNIKLMSGSAIVANDLLTNNLNLGELQGNYQSFHQEYIAFLNTQNNGFYQTQKAFLQRDLAEIK
ncbi:MAG: secretion protein HlyD, partial [Pedobacter sp.]